VHDPHANEHSKDFHMDIVDLSTEEQNLELDLGKKKSSWKKARSLGRF